MAPDANPILLYDGVCGLCNRFVQFTLRRDRNAVFRFAALQSLPAIEILRRHQVDRVQNDTVILVLDCNTPAERLLFRSDAALFVLARCVAPWPTLARLGALVPRSVRDVFYRCLARHRYRLFGRYDSCPLPGPEVRLRFLDVQSSTLPKNPSANQ